MTPFYFGSGQRRLFGIYTPAALSVASKRAVVICHPWGAEYLYAYRAMRQLASMLSASGFHVLRFDYYGTGDSSGDMGRADLKGWEDDIEIAVEELKETTGAKWCALVGLRLGATLAASVAAKQVKDLDALVLWDPVVSGNEYLKELMLGPSLISPDGSNCKTAEDECVVHEVHGFQLTPDLVREIRALDLTALIPALRAQVLVILTGAGCALEALGSAVQDYSSRPLAVEVMASQPAWLEEGNSGAAVIPVKVLQRIVGWLE